MTRFLAATAIAAVLAAPLSAPSVAWAAAASPAPSPSPTTFFGLPRGNPALAAGLSLGVNGLGQYYNQQPDKGGMMLASLLTFPVAYGVDQLTGSSTLSLFSYAIILAVKGWSVLDAYQQAAPAPAPSPAPTPGKP